MIGIVVAAHGRLATELVETAALIIGDLPHVRAVNVSPGQSPLALEESLREVIRELDDGDGVLLLADLIGGSPCNKSMALCRITQAEVLTGVNLPMLLKAHSLRRTHGLRALSQQLVEASRASVRWVTEETRPAALGDRPASTG